MITIKKLHNEFFKEVLGFKPDKGNIKPVHFINNISREILGYHYINENLYDFIEPRNKNKKLDENRTYEKLNELPFYDQLDDKSQFETIRRRAKGLLHSDGAVFVNSKMVSFTAANEFFIEDDTMGSGIKNYHKSLFEIDLGNNQNIANLLSQNLTSNQDDLYKLDPITILFYPLLSQKKENDDATMCQNYYITTILV